MELQLADRVAIVTGGGMGIGRAVARELLLEGMSVAICSRTLRTLETTAGELMAEVSGRVEPIVVDTTDMSSVGSMVSETMQRFGRVDLLVNGAAAPGGMVRSDLREANDQGLLQDLDTKVVGYFRCAKAVAVPMREAKFGRIVNIGGLTGRSSRRLSGMRNVAICHLTKNLSDQLGPDGITVNVVHPGVTETEHSHDLYAKEAKKQGLSAREIESNYIKETPIRRIIQPEEVAQLIAFLASPIAGAITGESIAIDGGMNRGIYL